MTKPEHAQGYVPNPEFSQDDWDEVSDNPELTEEQIRTAKPVDEAMPELAAAMRRSRGPQKAPTKELISLRVDRRALEHFRSTGPGWQGRMNEVLLKAAGLD